MLPPVVFMQKRERLRIRTRPDKGIYIIREMNLLDGPGRTGTGSSHQRER